VTDNICSSSAFITLQPKELLLLNKRYSMLLKTNVTLKYFVSHKGKYETDFGGTAGEKGNSKHTMTGTVRWARAARGREGRVRFPVGSCRRLENRYLRPVQSRAGWVQGNGSRVVLSLIRHQYSIHCERTSGKRGSQLVRCAIFLSQLSLNVFVIWELRNQHSSQIFVVVNRF